MRSDEILAEDMASNNTNKRRRTAADTLHISDLPTGFIADVSAYLPKPSRAILSVAFSGPSSSWQNDNLMHQLTPISKAIISASQWDIVDFEEIDERLAGALNDDDINAILKSINAHDVLKRLKLCGCLNITGIGLNPLRGSVTLEQVDLSLIRKHESPKIIELKPQPKISQEYVVPILDGIISADGCSLKYIMFPCQEVANPNSEALRQLRQRYNLLCDNRELSCSHCNVHMDDETMTSWFSSSCDRMFQNNVCYDCLKPFCDNCADTSSDGDGTLNFCNSCDKDFCVDCVPRTECCTGGCDSNMCSGCAERSLCQACHRTKCGQCLNTCDGCKRTTCDGCETYHRCSKCEKEYCADCRFGKEYDGRCEECKSIHKSTK